VINSSACGRKCTTTTNHIVLLLLKSNKKCLNLGCPSLDAHVSYGKIDLNIRFCYRVRAFVGMLENMLPLALVFTLHIVPKMKSC